MTQQVPFPPKFDRGTSWGEFWTLLLNGWLELVKSYEEPKTTDEGPGLTSWQDISYWYGERSLTGLLAAAAWRVGGWSLEEVGIDRRKKCGKDCRGHVDLWVGWQKEASSVEAKILWIEQENIESNVAAISRKLRKARKQLRTLQGDCRVGRPIAICYAVPCFPNPGGLDTGRRVLAELQAKAKEEGWATVRHEAHNADVEEKRERCMYPGVLLIAKKVKWQDRLASRAT